jgi:Fe-S cluster biogenesis protein NfuA
VHRGQPRSGSAVCGSAGSTAYDGDMGGLLDEEKVREVIEVIRPAIQADNGDIYLREVDVDNGVVKVELIGACVTCPASTQTLKAGIERILKDRLEGVNEVVNVGDTATEFSETPISL